MNIQELKNKSRQFDKEEGRASFYDLAVEIVDKYPNQAAILLLATWNVSRFRFMVSDARNLEGLIDAVKDTCPVFEVLYDREFQSVDFDDVKNHVKYIYSALSKVKGVEYTGASKLMHLFNRNLFVMWDGYIRKKYGYGTSADDYLGFLKEMQVQFAGIKWDNQQKTLAKVIDEYNYVTISLPAVRKKKK